MKGNYKYILTTKEDRQFNNFLNKTIIGVSYNYFNEDKKIKESSENLIDEIFFDYIKEDNKLENAENIHLAKAIKSLNKNEKLVISFIFEDKLKGDEIADLLKIQPNTVYLIKRKALKKLKKSIKENMEL